MRDITLDSELHRFLALGALPDSPEAAIWVLRMEKQAFLDDHGQLFLRRPPHDSPMLVPPIRVRPAILSHLHAVG